MSHCIKAMRGWLALSTLLAFGCAPRVDEFLAEPHTLCAGDAVTLRWKTLGVTTLTSRPPVLGGGAQEVKSNGSISVSPTRSTRFELVATSSGRTARGYADVHVLPEAKVVPLGSSIQGCDARSAWATIDPLARLWTGHARVSSVRVLDGRSYRVEHEGRIGEIGPGAPSLAFAGTKVHKPWILRSPLAPGEQCRTETVPRTLMIGVTTECATEKAHHEPSRAP